MLVGTVELGSRPITVLVPDFSKLKEELERARALGIDLIEARVDLMERGKEREALDLIANYGFYSILTVRPTWEGGKFEGGEEERLTLFKRLLPHPAVGAVDVELRAEILPQVSELAGKERKRLIVSFHDFKETPSEEEIASSFKEAVKKGADIVKLAYFGRSPSDAARVCSTLFKFKEPKVFMVMGEEGRFTRVVGFSFGSLLTYTFFGKAVAPGQIEAEDLIKELSFYYPEYRKFRKKLLKGL
ncbi:type I 3-dehydroquinate dehydratase [Thermovibrio sp.]